MSKQRKIRRYYGEVPGRPMRDWGPSKTRQSEAADADINVIMARYEKTGRLPLGDGRDPQYLDVSELGDYRTVLDQVRAAEAVFMQFPAKVRAEFDNDPAAFLDFVVDPANEEEVRKMGLKGPGEPSEPRSDGEPTGDTGEAGTAS